MIIIVFDSVHYILKTEKLLKAEKVDYEIIPTPRELSSDCGTVIKIAKNDKGKVVEILTANKLNGEFIDWEK